ncbi:MAG: hypothetical protein HN929_10460 [Chloroflexi bacterium]|jgi:hypothetical protein|nr:hypothetical protein [Chloroflexota bacterium]MBT7081872.1 hypothetical protein [Chloroflexota bacterium]MBT7290740.1 hypothetical protein [Chloroflexota bacterium]
MKKATDQQARNLKLKKIVISTMLIVILMSVFCWPTISNPLPAIAQQSAEIDNKAVATAKPETDVNAEMPKYNLSSVTTNTRLQVTSGNQISADIYFYNVDGNRTTKIKLDAIDLAQGWKVKYSNSNIKVEPTQISSEPITDIPDGMISLRLPNKLGEGIPGYCLAHVVTVTINVPEKSTTATVSNVTIEATAKWSGQTGMVHITQTRNFELNIVR